jgi:hypothetical protein
MIDHSCPCAVCGIPTNPKWDGSLSTTNCTRHEKSVDEINSNVSNIVNPVKNKIESLQGMIKSLKFNQANVSQLLALLTTIGIDSRNAAHELKQLEGIKIPLGCNKHFCPEHRDAENHECEN